MFRGWGGFVYRFRWAVLVVSLLAVVASAIAITRFSTALSSNDNGGTYLESLRALSVMRDELPSQQGSSFQIIFAAKDPNLKAADPAFVQAVDAALAPLRSDARVSAITTSPNFVSTDGRRTFAIVTMPAEYDVAKDQYPDLRAKVQSASLTTISTGYIPINEDFNRILDHDLQRAEVVGLPLSLVVLIIVFGGVLWRLLRRSSLRTAGLALLLTFGSLGLALIPVLIGLFTLAGGVAGIYALAHSRDMSVYGLNIASMIGLGVSIDYSLFIISRFLEEVPRRSVRDAIVRTIETTGKAITFSGLTVAIGVAGLLFYRSPMLQSMGLAAILVVVTAVFYGLTFLPALLAVTGNGIAARASRRAAQPAEQAPARATRAATGGGLWHRVAGGVMSHPWLTLLPLLALLLLAGSPFLRLRLSPTDVNALPAGTESREGWALLTQEFPGSENTSVTVVVRYPDGQPLGAAHVGQLYDYGRWLAGLPDVARVKSVVTPPGPDGKPLPKEAVVALYAAPQATWPQELQTQVHNTVGAHLVTLSVLTPLDPHSDAARDLVRRIRAGGPANPGGEVLVTGETALNIDQIASIKADTVPAAAFIMGATYVVLFLLLGSVLLPLKAVLMNLLSISASYGALVWIFQDGHLSNLLGFTPAGIDPLIPVLMFCILFGLSMDYEVLLLSRMKEEYDRTGDNRHAVLEGLEQTGRLITGAAAIMVFVFGGFGMAQITLIKSIGVGMALAVTVDALLVRTLIIPATMRLLGDLNWWAPAPLARLYRRLGLAEQSGDHGATPAVAVAGAGTTGEPERELVGAGRGDR